MSSQKAAKNKAKKAAPKPSAKNEERSDPRQFFFREYLEALLIAGIFLGFSNTFIIKTFYIPSESMVDTLLVGDHLFVNRLIYGQSETLGEVMPSRETRRGDVVIFRSPESPETDLVKRCVGVPGDRIEIINKQLIVNGEPVDDSAYTQHTDPRVFRNPHLVAKPQSEVRDNFGPFEVPPDHFFFLGDNRDESYDSRYWGPVPRRYIKGRALLIYWSYGGETPDGNWPGWTAKLRQAAGTAVGFFTETRWDRTFHLVR